MILRLVIAELHRRRIAPSRWRIVRTSRSTALCLLACLALTGCPRGTGGSDSTTPGTDGASATDGATGTCGRSDLAALFSATG